MRRAFEALALGVLADVAKQRANRGLGFGAVGNLD